MPAMNGWADPEPACGSTSRPIPEAMVELSSGRRRVIARAATPEERARLWARYLDLGSSAFTDASAALRSRETALVILEPSGTARPDSRAVAVAQSTVANCGSWSVYDGTNDLSSYIASSVAVGMATSCASGIAAPLPSSQAEAHSRPASGPR